ASISPVFPEIMRALNISGREVGLLITFFTFPGMVLTPILGILADNYGRKKILVPSLLLFGAAGGMCGFARDFELLLILRFIQGIGMASLGVLNITILGDLYTGTERSRAIGYNSATVSIGIAIYPVIGGVIAVAGWYYPFFLAFLAIPAGLLILFYLDNPEPDNNKNIKEYLRSAFKAAINKNVILIFINSFITFLVIFGTVVIYFPLFLEERFSLSAVEIGLIMSALSLATAAASSQMGKLNKLFSKRALLYIAFGLYSAGLFIVPFVDNIWLMSVPLLLYGIGNGINIPNFIAMLADYTAEEHRAVMMSISGIFLRFGQTIGPILMGYIFIICGINGTFFAASFISVIMIFTFLIIK
ncbi:MFS transporter, partial [candidate division KSB1 bacterium]